MHEKLGTSYYIAPEVLNKKYDNKCDLWSLGVITYTVLCGCPPFTGENDNEIMDRVKIGKFCFHDQSWKNISEERNNRDKKKKS